MIALSLTAIGMRPLCECLEIAEALRDPLQLNAVELAFGVECDVQDDYGSWPLIVHDSCLSADQRRLRLDPLIPSTWRPYRDFVDRNDVRLVSVHPPARRRCTLARLERAICDLEQLSLIHI